MENKLQLLCESLSSVLNVEVTVVDTTLLRVAGTGSFYSRINESSPTNSLFAKVLKSGIPEINIFDANNPTCLLCERSSTCKERKNIIYPIKDENEIYGVVCFATFDLKQDDIIIDKKDEYLQMIKHTAENIQKEITAIKVINQLNNTKTETNGIINCINRGIIILDSKQNIMHINSKAINSLDLNISVNKVINRNINELVTNLKLKETNDKVLLGSWIINKKNLRVLYKIHYIILDKKNVTTLIDFEMLEEVLNIALTYSDSTKAGFENIVGESKVMKDLIGNAKIVAKSDSTIFLGGSSGTGKEVFAKAIHSESFRRDAPFVPINCATLPENLIESELFGYEKGSFTGANLKGKIGKFEQANNGTLFLDEIADLPLHLQAKLLRVLQEKTIDKIGSTNSKSINVRIISATRKNIEKLVEKNEFREDLYYRLNVIPLDLPDLKDREDDVLLIAEFILTKICKKMNKNKKMFSKETISCFKNYSWPGNVRELENIIEYTVNFSESEEITINNLPRYFLDNMVNIKDMNSIISDNNDNIKELDVMVRAYEKKIINHLLNIHGNSMDSKKTVAKILNISLTSLYRKLNDYC